MGTIIEKSRSYSNERFQLLRNELTEAAGICAETACVYATGSFGREEATKYSDLDIFIVSLGAEGKDHRRLSNLDEICLKAELIKATKILHFPAFSGDGRFLQHHTVHKLVNSIGTDNDDAINTFTARLLLLLESRPLVGNEVHRQVVDEVIAKYWREFTYHTDDFMPAFLANDILRYWRTLCLNYEARTSADTPEAKAERKLKNYNLKHSRLLTCYSALMVLLDIYCKNKTVTVADAKSLIAMTPTSRIESIAVNSKNIELSKALSDLVDLYVRFLETRDASKEDLLRLFSDPKRTEDLQSEQLKFGDLVYKSMYLIGCNSAFYRRLVV